MTETARYSKIMLEDLDLGTGTRSVRLADGATYTLKQVHLSGFLTQSLFRLTSSNGASVLTATAKLPANSRVWGVTAKVVTTFGNSGGLTGLLVGDSTTVDRWTSSAMARTSGTETDQGDFNDASLMIYATATDVLVSAVGGTFDTDGVIELCVHYNVLTHPA